MTGSNLELIEVYSEGIKAWFPDEELGWVSASVVSKQVDAKSAKISFQDDMDAEKVNYRRIFFYDSPAMCWFLLCLLATCIWSEYCRYRIEQSESATTSKPS